MELNPAVESFSTVAAGILVLAVIVAYNFWLASKV